MTTRKGMQVKKIKYSKAQIKSLEDAIHSAAKRCRKNAANSSKVKVWEAIIHPDGWPQTTHDSHKEYARTIFQEPATGLGRRVVLLVDSARIGIPTLGPHGKENEYTPFDARSICTSLEHITDSARQALTGESDGSRDMLQYYIDALTKLQ